MSKKHIRNFSIIAHVDHGKSTLADRFLELTGTIEKRKMKEQVLDTMDLERERGITIKMAPVRMIYQPKNQKSKIKNQNDISKFKNNPPEADTKILPFDFCILNLIDTPGHVDFSYEVSRALVCCEGALLLVDAVEGVEAQTLSHFFLAERLGLRIIPVINKIDLANARLDEVRGEIENLFGFKREEIYAVSAKEGTGVEELLEAVVEKIPPPFEGGDDLRALVFDSFYESHKGVVAYIRIMDGRIQKNDNLFLKAKGKSFSAKEVGVMTPSLEPREKLEAGEVGYVVTGVKEPGSVRVGDTIVASPIRDALPGYNEPKPVVWASFFPTDQGNFFLLGEALSKLKLNDSSLVFEEQSSQVLGRGYECGFLGTLHLEIIAERLRREFRVDFIVTHPSVGYRVHRGEIQKTVSSPALFPRRNERDLVEELWMKLEILSPNSYLQDIVRTLETFGGEVGEIKNIGDMRIICNAHLPLREMVSGFFDALKSATHGYASFNYEEGAWRPAELTRLDILVEGDRIEALSRVVLAESAEREARKVVAKVKEVLPRQLFKIRIQGEIEGRIVASQTIAALKKDVTGYLYGGDRSRKMKLWKKQKEGKERLKEHGKVSITPDVYLKLLKI